MLDIPDIYDTTVEYSYTFWFLFTSKTNLDVNN